MKNRNRYLLILVGLVAAYCSLAQEITSDQYPDTLRIENDGKSDLIIAMKYMRSKETYLTNELYQSILNIMESAIESSSYDGGIKVTYQKVEVDGEEKAQVQIIPLAPPNDLYLIGKDGMEVYSATRIELQIIQPKMTLSFFIEEVGELASFKSVDIESVWPQIDQKYEEDGKNHLYKGAGSVQYDQVKLEEITSSQGRVDNMEITILGFGLGFYRDRFVPDLGPMVAFNLHDRLGKPFVQFGVIYTAQYFFEKQPEGNFNVDVNGFLTGFCKRYFSSTEIGLGIGGRIHGSGDFYRGDTFKIQAYTSKRNSNLSFSPELVFTNNMRDFFPAIRFGLSF